MSENLMENLNKEQLQAVQHKDGPLLIVAGAGTGKTTVITQRIAYLIEQDFAKSDEILALTFTEKAAAEMSDRVDRLLPIGYLDLWISTFHSFGEKILKDHGIEIGLPGDFKLLNEFQQYSLIKKNLDKFNLDYYRPMGNPTKFIKALVSHFSRAKDEDISPDEYLKYAEELKQNLDSMLGGLNQKSKRLKPIEDKKIAEQEVLRINEVANAYHIYQKLLLDNGYLDFGDLINYTLKLFRQRPVILEKYRRQFKYVLLDEFQDTNLAQYELIKLLASPKNNLVVVGDDDQSIYKFRGASVSNILQFKKDFPRAKELVLVSNYRNRQNILDLSYDFIQQNNPNRLECRLSKNSQAKTGGLCKKLKAFQKGDGVIELIQGDDLDDEVRLVVEKIADLKIKSKKTAKSGGGEEASWSDFAVLVRSNEAAKDFCGAFDQAELPYLFFSSRGLYAKPEVMNVISYLKLLDNYHESPAVFRVLNMPLFNFSHSELMELNHQARKKAWSLFACLRNSGGNFGPETQKKINNFLSLVERHTVIARNKSASEAIVAFLNDSGYLKYLLSQKENDGLNSMAFLNKFLKRVKEFESNSDDKSVKMFLEELQSEIDAGEQGALPLDPEAGPEAIKIMTIHSAKGLEFKYVFIANMVDKRFPTTEKKEAIPIPDDLVKEILPEGDIHLEEERRLFYVAVTRAKNNLYFSWAPNYGGVRPKKPSRFLAEIGLVDPLELTAGFKNKNMDFFKLPKKYEKSAREDKEYIKIPSHFSYTQLAAFSKCPYQYRFAHILRIPGTGKHPFSFGRTMHLSLQKSFELLESRRSSKQEDLFGDDKKKKNDNPKISLEEMLSFYNESWVDDWYPDQKTKDEHRQKGREIIKGFYAKHKDNWPKADFLEKGFNIKITVDKKLYTIKGAIDRVDDVGGKIRIVDYKTGQPKEKLSFEEKEQLFLYQLAASQVFEKEVAGLSFYYLNNNSELEFLGSEKDLEKIQDKIIKTIKDINKCEFPAKPGPLCAYCDFKDICEFKKA